MSDTPLKIPYIPHAIDTDQGALGFLDKIKDARKTIKKKLEKGESIIIPSEESAKPIVIIDRPNHTITRYLTDTVVENMVTRYLMLGGPMPVFNLTGKFVPPTKGSPLYIEPFLYLYEVFYLLRLVESRPSSLFNALSGGYKMSTGRPRYDNGPIGAQLPSYFDFTPPQKISADLIMLLLYAYAQASVTSPVEGATTEGAKLGYFLCSGVPNYSVSTDYRSSQEDTTVHTYELDSDYILGDHLIFVSEDVRDPVITSPFFDEDNQPILTDNGKEVGRIIQENAEALNKSIFEDANVMFTDFSKEVNDSDHGAKLSCSKLNDISNSLKMVKCVHASRVNTNGTIALGKFGISSFRTKGASYKSVVKITDSYTDLDYEPGSGSIWNDQSYVRTYDHSREYADKDNSIFRGFTVDYYQLYANNEISTTDGKSPALVGYSTFLNAAPPTITNISGDIYMFISTESITDVDFNLVEGNPPVTPGKFAHLRTYMETLGSYTTSYETNLVVLNQWPGLYRVGGLTRTYTTKRINHIFISNDIVFEYVGFSSSEDVNANFYKDGRELYEKEGKIPTDTYIVYKAPLAEIYKKAAEPVVGAINKEIKDWEDNELKTIRSSSASGETYLNVSSGYNIGNLDRLCSLDIELNIQLPTS